MIPIRLPRVAAKMRDFAEVETVSHGRAVEIHQTKTAAIVTAADGHQLCRIVAEAPAGTSLEPAEPFLIDGRDLAKAAAAVGCSRTEKIVPGEADRPLVVFKVDPKQAGITGPEGSPQLLPIAPGAMPNCVGIIDAIQGEAASGMTKAVARINPRFLQSLADTAVAMNVGSIEITFAPRWNFMLAEGSSPDGCTIQVAIAGIGEVKLVEATQEKPSAVDTDSLTFTMPEPRQRSSSKRKPPSGSLRLSFEDDLPF
jgi:hypothetical protein